MKKQSLLIFFAVSLFFVGCTIEKRHYNSGYHVEWLSQKGKVKKAEPVAQPEKENEQSLAVKQEDSSTNQESFTEAPVVAEPITAPMVNETVAENAERKVVKQKSQKQAQKREDTLNQVKVEKSTSKSVGKGFSTESSLSDMDSSSSPTEVDVIILVILAILLPPLAVFLHSGIGTPFWISLILTLLFWIPGVIYALLVVLDVI